jgi:hypothetical protein
LTIDGERESVGDRALEVGVDVVEADREGVLEKKGLFRIQRKLQEASKNLP